MYEDARVTLKNETWAIVNGVEKPTVTAVRTVWGKRRSATRKEYYDAEKAGHKVTDVFVVFHFEYNDEPLVECGGKTYRVVRAYRDEPDTVQLNCEVAV